MHSVRWQSSWDGPLKRCASTYLCLWVCGWVWMWVWGVGVGVGVGCGGVCVVGVGVGGCSRWSVSSTGI